MVLAIYYRVYNTLYSILCLYPIIYPLQTTGTATEYVQTGPAPPPVTTDPLDPGQLSISPELARLVNSMQKAGHPMPPNHANGGPGSVNSNVQNLLSNIMVFTCIVLCIFTAFEIFSVSLYIKFKHMIKVKPEN